MTQVGLDEAAVSAWLDGCDLGLRLPLTFARIGLGQSNLTFMVTDATGARLILRRPPLGRLLASAHDVAREHRILKALESTPVPTPAVLAFTEDPAVTDAPLLAVAHVEGLVVDNVQVAEALSPSRRGSLGLALATALEPIHAVDLGATGLEDLASHKPFAARQLKRWRRQWEDSRTRDLKAVDDLADRLEAAIPPQEEVTLVHGDFHLSNVIVAPDGSHVRAVLDWELCTLGDPLADLGCLLAYWPADGEPATGPLLATRLPGFPSRREMAARYGDETGRSLDAVGFWHTLALWKIAIIAEGVRRRTLDDPRNAAEVSAPAAHVDDFIARALRVAAEAGL
ncbi:phosphotransferase family protein [Nocardioides gansuensis]|uniref:Phosphotransferase family protein n=1 Tax=Nocardioides gansuensis TaxID=2138300 RepID=A0A2T8F657_9ACTN|nr:phosphotransferase family protein [Nocardioides gansuensis]PVG81192.1 phosphotransferase family protein [Nocardioides gansuensis]